ncbi:hypothetical protein [Nocardia sp. NPDC052566]|uniref:terpene synthase family protein n=1 Tax=Nocardia sp. NPDC052566 TaxID=3364330 RepID=UPI0037C6E5D1
MTADLPEGFLSFWMPIQAQVAPNRQTLTGECVAWAREKHIGGGDPDVAAVYGHSGASLLAYAFPHATGPMQRALADYSAWAFVPDDVADATINGSPPRTCEVVHELSRLARMTRSPDSWADDTTTSENALRDTIIRIRAHCSAVQFERFWRRQEIWLFQLVWATALRERGIPPGVNEYMAMRIGSVGLYATQGYIHLVENIEPTNAELARPLVQAAAEAGLTVATLDNERYSSVRERALDQDELALASALRVDSPGLTAAESMRGVVTIRDRILALYLRLRDQVRTDASPDLHKYFTGIDLVIAGNVAFGARAARYLNPAAGRTYQTTSATPEGLSREPLPYPTIAWWWHHLRGERA